MDPSLYVDSGLSKSFRIGAFFFLLLALTFSYFNNNIKYLLDVTGISGKEPSLRQQTVEPAAQKPEQKKKAQDKLRRPTMPPGKQDFLLIPRTEAVKIDGQANDWILAGGRFFTGDIEQEAENLSLWTHFMYDEEAVYVFFRLRDSTRSWNDTPIDEDPTDMPCLQLQFLIKQATLINFWRDETRGWQVQHQVLSKGRKSDRVAAGEVGIRFASQGHRDGFGSNLEVRIPWTAVMKSPWKGNAVPQPGQRLAMGFAAKFAKVSAFGTVAGSKFPRRLGSAITLAERPLGPTFVRPAKGWEHYVARFANGRPKLNLEHPLRSVRPWNRRLPITPARNVIVDGQGNDWPLTAGTIFADRVYAVNNGGLWLHAAADQQDLYLFAVITDPTPASAHDRLQIDLVTDERHQIDFLPKKGILIDSKVQAVEFVRHIRPDGSGYQMEARVPWSMVGGRPQGSFPITGRVQLNLHWQLEGLMRTLPDRYDRDDPDTWARAEFLQTAPPSPLGAGLITGEIFPVKVNAGKLIVNGRAAARQPHATANRELRVRPGTAVVDGEIAEWDLRGGVFMCRDTRQWQNTSAAWVHAMYDADRIYFLFRFHDSTPLEHSEPKLTDNDCAIIRMYTDQWITVTAARNHQDESETIVTIKESPKEKAKTLEPEEHQVQTAFQRDPDGRGYRQEIAIPWSTVRSLQKAPDPGQKCWLTIAFCTDRDMWTRDLLQPGANMRRVQQEVRGWGVAVFTQPQEVPLQPVPLWNGNSLPVTMLDGKPSLKRGVETERR